MLVSLVLRDFLLVTCIENILAYDSLNFFKNKNDEVRTLYINTK